MVLTPGESGPVGLRIDLDLRPEVLEELRGRTALKDGFLMTMTSKGPMALSFAAQKKFAPVIETPEAAEVKHRLIVPAQAPYFMQLETLAPPTNWQKALTVDGIPRKQRRVVGLAEMEQADDDLVFHRFEYCKPFPRDPKATISRRDFPAPPMSGRQLTVLVVEAEQIALDEESNATADPVRALREKLGDAGLTELLGPAALPLATKDTILEYRNAEPIAIYTVRVDPLEQLR